ncbi:hypothetical protein GCM10018772_68760 [Streptomyces fumanus]|uniref:Uncharacterized protein n=1 Tax=Streptomyces fumanus TaxID=67302 RepID=A0A919AZ32_9ACTN|nr:hypothetical protein GCM10018772_68760 [Streptomyces fumanus]
MMTERGMAAPADGGSVLAQFDDVLAAAAPELAGHVQAAGFVADTPLPHPDPYVPADTASGPSPAARPPPTPADHPSG